METLLFNLVVFRNVPKRERSVTFMTGRIKALSTPSSGYDMNIFACKRLTERSSIIKSVSARPTVYS